MHIIKGYLLSQFIISNVVEEDVLALVEPVLLASEINIIIKICF